MKKLVIKVYDMDYSGHDFCGEISGPDAVKIFESQPKEHFIEHNDLYETDYDEEIEDWCYENGFLNPTKYKYSLMD